MSQPIRILYIDDDQSNLDSIKKALTRQGYIMLTANTGTTGIEVAKKEHPDLMLVDILLPDMNGFEVCQALRDDIAFEQIPILALTATSIDSDHQSHLMGFDEFISKTVSRIDLIAIIEKYTS